jgi:glycosyltransferase
LKVSIITVSYNSESTIGDTIKSVISQTYKNIEYLIIDGNSVDNTLNIIKKYNSKIYKIVSENDNGIYDAMNKGINLATGDIIAILNSDDVYSNVNVINNVVEKFKQNSISCLYGDLVYTKKNDLNKITRFWKSGKYINNSFLYGWMPPHPTFFVKREIYLKYGYFRLNLSSAADYEIMLRIIHKNNERVFYFPEILIKMREGGVSNDNLLNRLRANKQDKIAWSINEIKPYFFTLWLKPLRKIHQFFVKS